jgi:HprK-related kinase A
MTEHLMNEAEWAARLTTDGLVMRSGPFTARVQTRIPRLIEEIRLLYTGYPMPQGRDFVDFHVSVEMPRKLPWNRRQAVFRIDGQTPFGVVPVEQALTTFEWGLNWAIWGNAHNYLIIHAATIAKNRWAVIMPGVAGAGKSTLTAGLVHRGWRLLSDELALVSPADGAITPVVRPINLKNASIEIISRFLPGATFSGKAYETIKGTVALLKAPPESIAAIDEPAMPAWVIFPKYVPGSTAALKSISKAASFLEIGNNAFNYSIHGTLGFQVLARLIDACSCYSFTYSSLEEAVAVFQELQPAG